MKQERIMQIIHCLTALVLLGFLIQIGRVLERLDRVEALCSQYVQTVQMQGSVTRAEYMQLRDIHLLAGDLDE